MRPVRLGRIAAEAEAVRWKSRASQAGRRAAFGAVAAVFGLFMLGALHVAGYLALLAYVIPLYAVLIVLGVDFLFALIFGVLASRGGASAVETEALAVRNTALRQLGEYGAATALVPALIKRVPVRGLVGALVAAGLASMLARRRTT